MQVNFGAKKTAVKKQAKASKNARNKSLEIRNPMCERKPYMQNEQTEKINLKTFNENFDLTRSGRAVPKNSLALDSAPVRHTADGETFNQGTNYFFFDESNLTVRESAGLVPVAEHLTGANGFKIVPIDRVRSARSAALADGQNYLREEIRKASALIAEFELQKAPESQSLKNYLIAQDAAK